MLWFYYHRTTTSQWVNHVAAWESKYLDVNLLVLTITAGGLVFSVEYIMPSLSLLLSSQEMARIIAFAESTSSRQLVAMCNNDSNCCCCSCFSSKPTMVFLIFSMGSYHNWITLASRLSVPEVYLRYYLEIQGADPRLTQRRNFRLRDFGTFFRRPCKLWFHIHFFHQHI